MARGKTTTSSMREPYTSSRKRRRTSTTTLVKWQAPTAKNQRKQIMSNAKAISRLYKIAVPPQVYCDWQLFGTLNSRLDAGNFTTTWQAFPLMSFTDWAAVLRQDDNVTESSSTQVKRLSINMRYVLNRSDWANFNIWIVTPRKDASNRDPATDFAAGNLPVQGTDFTSGPDGFCIRLNPAMYKVHFASYKTLTETTLFQGALPLAPAGNPNTTWSKGQANIRCNAKVRAVTNGNSWRQLPYQSLPYYQNYYLLCAIVQNAPQATPAGQGAFFSFDQLATTVNMD